MWVYEKKLQFPIKIKNPDPKAASIIISQLGGAYGKEVMRELFEGLEKLFPKKLLEYIPSFQRSEAKPQ